MEKGLVISASSVRFSETTLWIDLSDGRIIGVPLSWFPRLANASAESRNEFTLSPFGIHWESLDEDISIAGLLAGRGDLRKVGKVA
jgi:hypothetical protein